MMQIRQMDIMDVFYRVLEQGPKRAPLIQHRCNFAGPYLPKILDLGCIRQSIIQTGSKPNGHDPMAINLLITWH